MYQVKLITCIVLGLLTPLRGHADDKDLPKPAQVQCADALAAVASQASFKMGAFSPIHVSGGQFHEILNQETLGPGQFVDGRVTLDNIPSAAATLLDLEELSPENLSINYTKDGKIRYRISPNHVRHLSTHPILNPKEIRTRQDAVSEIFEGSDGTNFLANLKGIFESDASKSWRRHLFFFSEEPFSNTEEELKIGWTWQFIPGFSDVTREEQILLSRKLDGEDRSRYENQVNQLNKSRLAMISEIDQLRHVLYGAKSVRLQAIRWNLDALFEDAHPRNLSRFIRDFKNTPDPTERSRLVSNFFNFDSWAWKSEGKATEEYEELKHKRKVFGLALAMKSYAELGHYYDLALRAQLDSFTSDAGSV